MWDHIVTQFHTSRHVQVQNAGIPRNPNDASWAEEILNLESQDTGVVVVGGFDMTNSIKA